MQELNVQSLSRTKEFIALIVNPMLSDLPGTLADVFAVDMPTSAHLLSYSTSFFRMCGTRMFRKQTSSTRLPHLVDGSALI